MGKEKETSAKQGLTMAEAHKRIGELKERPRIEAKPSGKAVPRSEIGKSGGRKGER